MTEHVIFSISLLVLVIMAFCAIIYYIRAKHLEKIEMIKHGEFVFESNSMENRKWSALGKGILLVSLALGLGIAYLLILKLELSDASAIVIYLICLLGSGGLGLLGYYWIIQKKVK
jgi:hypothetical protein